MSFAEERWSAPGAVAIAIPTIPPRREMLQRAFASVLAQTRPAGEIHVAVDHQHEGAPTTRNRAARAARLPWLAFLDDDDELLPHHLEACLGHAMLTGADLVYPWYEVVGGTDPHPHVFGRYWDPENPVQTTITILIRRELFEELGGYMVPGDDTDEHGNRAGEDFDLVCRANQLGAKISHLPVRTWKWNHGGHNTSGVGSRW